MEIKHEVWSAATILGDPVVVNWATGRIHHRPSQDQREFTRPASKTSLILPVVSSSRPEQFSLGLQGSKMKKKLNSPFTEKDKSAISNSSRQKAYEPQRQENE